MSSTVRVGERGVDFSFARPPAARLLELGYTFVVGYISVPPASPNKNITRAEIEGYREAGLKVGLVWEMAASRPNLGATYGEIDGKSARLEAVKRDWPMDIPIITACDLNSFADNIDRHEMYVRGFHKTIEQERIGLYGDTDILARTVGVWNIGWVPIGAWAWSGTSRADAIARAKAVGAHVLQSKGFYIDDVWAVDPNDVINPFPAWGLTTFPPPIPSPEDDVITINDIYKDAETQADKFVLMLNGKLRPIGQVELRILGIPLSLELGKPLSKADRDALGLYSDSVGAPDPRVDRLEAVTGQLNEAVGRTGQVVGDIQKGLGEAANARA